jgi:hypothetical protein
MLQVYQMQANLVGSLPQMVSTFVLMPRNFRLAHHQGHALDHSGFQVLFVLAGLEKAALPPSTQPQEDRAVRPSFLQPGVNIALLALEGHVIHAWGSSRPLSSRRAFLSGIYSFLDCIYRLPICTKEHEQKRWGIPPQGHEVSNHLPQLACWALFHTVCLASQCCCCNGPGSHTVPLWWPLLITHVCARPCKCIMNRSCLHETESQQVYTWVPGVGTHNLPLLTTGQHSAQMSSGQERQVMCSNTRHSG